MTPTYSTSTVTPYYSAYPKCELDQYLNIRMHIYLHQPLTIKHWPSPIHPPSSISHQPSAINHRLTFISVHSSFQAHSNSFQVPSGWVHVNPCLFEELLLHVRTLLWNRGGFENLLLVWTDVLLPVRTSFATCLNWSCVTFELIFCSCLNWWTSLQWYLPSMFTVTIPVLTFSKILTSSPTIVSSTA